MLKFLSRLKNTVFQQNHQIYYFQLPQLLLFYLGVCGMLLHNMSYVIVSFLFQIISSTVCQELHNIQELRWRILAFEVHYLMLLLGESCSLVHLASPPPPFHAATFFRSLRYQKQHSKDPALFFI